jgi:cytoskeleton protein RodZ
MTDREIDQAASAVGASEEQSVPTMTPPGAQLAARRSELKLSIEQVANQLNLAPRQIQALEDDNYGALPGMASVRGFIRAYAKLVKLDAGPLVQAIAHEAATVQVEPLGPALSTTPFSDRSVAGPGYGGLLKWLSAAVLVGALIALAVFGQQAGWLSGLTQEFSLRIDSASTRSPASATAEAAAEPSESPNGITREAVALPPPAAVGKPETRPAVTPAAPTPAAAAPAVAAPVPEIPAREALVLKMREDSWIDARRSDNTPLVSRLARAGETEVLKMNGPLSLTVGNAAGVDVILRGQQIELETMARSNVARVNLK